MVIDGGEQKRGEEGGLTGACGRKTLGEKVVFTDITKIGMPVMTASSRHVQQVTLVFQHTKHMSRVFQQCFLFVRLLQSWKSLILLKKDFELPGQQLFYCAFVGRKTCDWLRSQRER